MTADPITFFVGSVGEHAKFAGVAEINGIPAYPDKLGERRGGQI